MRVRARQVDRSSAPGDLKLSLGQVLLTTAAEYDIHAAAMFEGRLSFQLVDDQGIPSWYPAWLFDVVDQALPADWLCAVFRAEPSLLLGPNFITESIESYEAMVELRPDQVDRFWVRVQRQTGASSGDSSMRGREMRVRARAVDHATAPVEVRLSLGQIFLKAGLEYDVHAAAVFRGRLSFQLINDRGVPVWNTAWLFDVVDHALPADWLCSAFRAEPSLVLGPAFISESPESYESMVELHPDQVDRFWARVERLNGGPPGD